MREPSTFTRRAAAALIGPAAAAMPTASASDPVFAQIELHEALRLAIGKTSGEDDDPAYLTACDDEEAALQALGDAMPMTLGGAAALLAYMAEVEGNFADDGSPVLRTVLAVACGLQQMARAAS